MIFSALGLYSIVLSFNSHIQDRPTAKLTLVGNCARVSNISLNLKFLKVKKYEYMLLLNIWPSCIEQIVPLPNICFITFSRLIKLLKEPKLGKMCCYIIFKSVPKGSNFCFMYPLSNYSNIHWWDRDGLAVFLRAQGYRKCVCVCFKIWPNVHIITSQSSHKLTLN